MHIPLSDLENALQEARFGNSVILEGDGEAFRLERLGKVHAAAPDDGTFRTLRTDFRPLSVILADPDKKWSDVVMDDQWGHDMEQVLAENRAHDRDPWAE